MDIGSTSPMIETVLYAASPFSIGSSDLRRRIKNIANFRQYALWKHQVESVPVKISTINKYWILFRIGLKRKGKIEMPTSVYYIEFTPFWEHPRQKSLNG
ncbi:hypothetical protein H5410_011243 [Solanum commersonii]|uniref:Uncharacterized protein ycf15 n=1 Tax=Solanum commersonii TaxID=4109 RepID=A0A9J6ANU2_SOLCO|nr:hypothetical protein H5410_011243 [Solanum commersonii]